MQSGIAITDRPNVDAVASFFATRLVGGRLTGPVQISTEKAAMEILASAPMAAFGGAAYVPKLSELDPDAEENAAAYVWDDGANNGLWVVQEGQWTNVLPFLPGSQLLAATNVGAGTPDAVQATTPTSYDLSPYKALIAVNFVAANTGTMTLALNGETPRPLVTNTGAPITAGYISAGMAALVLIDADGSYRLFSYGDAAAIEAQIIALKAEVEVARDIAVTARSGAEAARDVALGAASSFLPNIFATEAIAEAYEPDFIPIFLRTAGKRSSDDGGGGLYAEPSVDEPAIGPKIFLPSINRWFTGTETVMDIMRFGARRMGSGTSGVIADNDAALLGAKDWLFGRLVGGAVPELNFGPGVYDYSEFPDFARNDAKIIGKGDCRLRFHGEGNALVIDGKHSLAPPIVSDGVWRMAFKGFTVEAPASAGGDVVILQAVHESDIQLEVAGGPSAFAGLRLQYLVSSHVHYRCSGNGGGWYDNAIPRYALHIDRHHPDVVVDDEVVQTDTSFCHIDAYTTGTDFGVFAEWSNGNMIRGTFQGHPVIGAHLDAKCQDTVFYNSDWEVNGTDIYCTGKMNTIENSTSLKLIIFDEGAEGNIIAGGVHAGIVLGETTKGNRIETRTKSRIGASSIADLGENNQIGDTWDMENDRWWKRPKQTLSVTPVGDVYTYQNLFGDPLVLAISGGTVAAIAINGEPVTSTSGQFMLPPGAVAQWVASVEPTAKVWGL